MIKELEQKVTELTKLFASMLAEAAAVDGKISQMEALDIRLRDLEKRVKEREKAVTIAENELKEQKLYLSKEHVKLDKNRSEIDQRLAKLDDIKAAMDALSAREQEAEAKIEAANIKIAQAEAVDKKLLDLKEQMALIEKEKIIDRQRKENLDLREAGIEQEKQRIKRVAEAMKVK